MPYIGLEQRRAYARDYYHKHKARRAEREKELRSRPEAKAKRAAYNALPEQKEKRAARQRVHADEHLKTNQRYRKNHPEKYKELTWNNNRRRNGWTPDSFEEARVVQDNRCAICGTSFDAAKIHADHEHTEPPKPRSLLCGLCNKGLGQFLDNPERLEAAAAYLRRWGK
jgi:hypothetical protein